MCKFKNYPLKSFLFYVNYELYGANDKIHHSIPKIMKEKQTGMDFVVNNVKQMS